MPQTTTLAVFALAAHFSKPLNLTVLDLADWATRLASEYPSAQQTPASIPLTPEAGITIGSVVIGQPVVVPRLTLTSADGEWMLILQDDRFAVGWNRTSPLGEPGNYPGYPAMKAFWKEELERFLRWHADRLGSAPFARVVEISYVNAAPLIRSDGSPKRMQDVLRYLDLQGRSVNAFTMIWSETLDGSPSGPSVAAQVGVGTAAQVLPASLDERTSLLFNFVGTGSVMGALNGAEVDDAVEALHSRILDMYAAAIISPG